MRAPTYIPTAELLPAIDIAEAEMFGPPHPAAGVHAVNRALQRRLAAIISYTDASVAEAGRIAGCRDKDHSHSMRRSWLRLDEGYQALWLASVIDAWLARQDR